MTTFTSADLGFTPITNQNSDLDYYKAFIAWAKEQFDFEPDYDDEHYPKSLADQPPFDFPEPDEWAYADFVATWDYVNVNHTADGVVFAFNADGELELSLWED